MKFTNEVAGYDKYNRPYYKQEYSKDRRRFKLVVDGVVHNVGVFVGEEGALEAAERYSKQIRKPVSIKNEVEILQGR